MKITDIKILVVNARMRNWVFVKVETDVPGLYGWGEGTLEARRIAAMGETYSMGIAPHNPNGPVAEW